MAPVLQIGSASFLAVALRRPRGSEPSETEAGTENVTEGELVEEYIWDGGLVDGPFSGVHFDVAFGESAALSKCPVPQATALDERQPVDQRPGLPKGGKITCASTERMEQVMGNRPKVGLEEGHSRFRAWLDGTAKVKT